MFVYKAHLKTNLIVPKCCTAHNRHKKVYEKCPTWSVVHVDSEHILYNPTSKIFDLSKSAEVLVSNYTYCEYQGKSSMKIAAV